MKKLILMLATVILIMFFSCIKKDNINKIEFLSIIAEEEISTTDPLVLHRIPVSDYSHTLPPHPIIVGNLFYLKLNET